MSTAEKISLVVGVGQLMVALLLWLGVDATTIKAAVTLRGAMIALLILGGFAFSGIAFFKTLTGTDSTTVDNVEDNVRKWVDAFSLGSQKMELPDTFFALKIVLRNNVPLTVYRPKSNGRYLQIQGVVTQDGDEKAAIEKLTNAQRRQLLQEMRVELSRAKIAYTIEPSLMTLSVIKSIPITTTLTEASFIAALDEVESALVLVANTSALSIARMARP